MCLWAGEKGFLQEQRGDDPSLDACLLAFEFCGEVYIPLLLLLTPSNPSFLGLPS